jgi:YggT family protein
MLAILNFIFFVIDALLSAIVWIVVINAVVSWLIAFDIINLRNPTAYRVVRFLDRVTAPLLAPFRRIIPPIGGLDLTPVILIVIISGIQRFLLPAFASWLIGLLVGPTV